ncbi:DUF4184 family protein [Hymenobacter glaciei]|uniref:DUF4184 family protein n=1 Tax=Hymenobacter glaciei TaxID=877209 RepID=A0ABP7TP07_9BACT
MPFTLFHPACVLPLRRLSHRWVSLTGLVAGSVAPDFEKFAKMRACNAYSHTWLSILYFTLPVGIGLTFVFHLLVRDELTRHLPTALRTRFTRFGRFDWPQHFRRYYPAVVFSVVLGGVSHLLWDNFTHWKSPFASWFPFLKMPFSLNGVHFQGFVVLNAISSLAGMGYLLWLVRGLPQQPVSDPLPARAQGNYWLLLAAVAVLIVGIKFLLFASLGDIWDQIITCFAAPVFSLVLTSAWFKVQPQPGPLQ